MRTLFPVLLLLPLLFTCNPTATQGGGDAGATSPEKNVPSIPSAWTIVSYSVNGNDFTPAVSPGSVLIEADQIGGNTGCNSFGGSWSGGPERMQIPSLMSTYMFCDAVAEQETALLSLLKGEVLTEIETDGHLLLKRGDLQFRLAPDPEHVFATIEPTTGEPKLMSGLFIYLADAAVFKRCSDGQRFGVLPEGDAYLATERAYLNAGPGGEWQRVELVGEVMENTEEEGLPYNLRITELVGFSAGGQCP